MSSGGCQGTEDGAAQTIASERRRLLRFGFGTEVTVSWIRRVRAFLTTDSSTSEMRISGRDGLTGIDFSPIFPPMGVEATRRVHIAHRGCDDLRAWYWPQVDDAISGHRHDIARSPG